MLQSDLAHRFAVPVSKVVATARDFPGDFCFQLEDWEIPFLASEFAEGRRRPLVFTERGILGFACAIGTSEAISIGVELVLEMAQLKHAGVHPRATALRSLQSGPV